MVSVTSKSEKEDVQQHKDHEPLKKKLKLESRRHSTTGRSESNWEVYKQPNRLRNGVGCCIPGAIDAGQEVTPSQEEYEDVPADVDDDADPRVLNESSSHGRFTDNLKESLSQMGEDDGTGDRDERGGQSQDSQVWALVRAIYQFGEVYEKMESLKVQQLVYLEKKQMELTRDLELERMQLFVQTQLEIAKMKYGPS